MLPEILLLEVETAAALMRATEALAVGAVCFHVSDQVPLGEKHPVTSRTRKVLLVIRFSVFLEKSPLGEHSFTAFHITWVTFMCVLVCSELAWQQESLVTSWFWAWIGQHLGVFKAVHSEVLMFNECLWTVFTLKLPLLVGILHVLVQCVFTCEQLVAVVTYTFERFYLVLDAFMRFLDVSRQVKLPCVLLVAAGVCALKRPFSIVHAHVPFEFLPVRKSCRTAIEATHEDGFIDRRRLLSLITSHCKPCY